ncbi:hypothetical protein D3C72_2459560 [compost metagenome]
MAIRRPSADRLTPGTWPLTILDSSEYATNSLMTTFWPISEPTVVASTHGVPITQAIGAST